MGSVAIWQAQGRKAGCLRGLGFLGGATAVPNPIPLDGAHNNYRTVPTTTIVYSQVHSPRRQSHAMVELAGGRRTVLPASRVGRLEQTAGPALGGRATGDRT